VVVVVSLTWQPYAYGVTVAVIMPYDDGGII
jgi:hypothetical protein